MLAFYPLSKAYGVFPASPINRHYKRSFQIGTLLKVNREDDDEEDFQLLLFSDIGLFIVEDSRLEEAAGMITELKGETA